MIPCPGDQQGQIFPHSLLPGCSHGSPSCRSTGAKIPPFLFPSLLSWFPLLQINRGKFSPIPFSLAALMVPSPADQQGQIFPHSFLPCCSHGSLSCRSTGANILPFLSPLLLSWSPLLLINRGKYSPIPFFLAALKVPSPADQQG